MSTMEQTASINPSMSLADQVHLQRRIEQILRLSKRKPEDGAMQLIALIGEHPEHSDFIRQTYSQARTNNEGYCSKA